MDPDKCLEDILANAAYFADHGGDRVDLSMRLAEDVQALDNWLKKEGASPKRWN